MVRTLSQEATGPGHQQQEGGELQHGPARSFLPQAAQQHIFFKYLNILTAPWKCPNSLSFLQEEGHLQYWPARSLLYQTAQQHVFQVFKYLAIAWNWHHSLLFLLSRK